MRLTYVCMVELNFLEQFQVDPLLLPVMLRLAYFIIIIIIISILKQYNPPPIIHIRWDYLLNRIANAE